MIVVNTHEAKTNLSKLLALVESKHECVRICRNGKPIALLVSVEEEITDPLVQHEELQGITFREDPSLPLDKEDWPEAWR